MKYFVTIKKSTKFLTFVWNCKDLRTKTVLRKNIGGDILLDFSVYITKL